MTTYDILGLLNTRTGSTPKRCGNGWIARCPAHNDTRPSLSISTGEDGRTLLHCHAGCPVESICAALGIRANDLFASAVAESPALVKIYRYVDEAGGLLFEKLRYVPKDFRIRRPHPKHPGRWIWGLGSVRRTPYLLPEALAAGDPLIVAEGEKDCETCRDFLHHPAVCNPFGAGKWTTDFSDADLHRWFGRFSRAVIIADKDRPGRKHATEVAVSLSFIPDIRIIECPDVEGKEVKDLSDYVRLGGSAEELQELIEATPPFDPEATEKEKEEARVAAPEETELEVEEPVSYAMTEAGTFRIRVGSHGERTILKIANFSARITREEVRDDGQNSRMVYVIEGARRGRALPPLRVAADKFLSHPWHADWGAEICIAAGQCMRDHFRAAVQVLSHDVERLCVYEHLGWRRIGGRWAWLCSSGAIHQDGLDTSGLAAHRRTLGLAVLQRGHPSGWSGHVCVG